MREVNRGLFWLFGLKDYSERIELSKDRLQTISGKNRLPHARSCGIGYVTVENEAKTPTEP